MTKAVAAAILTSVLAACAAPAEHTESCTTDNPPAAAGPVEKSGAPAAPVVEQDAGGPTEKPENQKNTFEYCAGYWNCFDFGQNWLRPSGNACQVGTMIQIFADGTATHGNERVGAGTWTGDAYNLELHFPALGESRPVVSCRRVPTDGD